MYFPISKALSLDQTDPVFSFSPFALFAFSSEKKLFTGLDLGETFDPVILHNYLTSSSLTPMQFEELLFIFKQHPSTSGTAVEQNNYRLNFTNCPWYTIHQDALKMPT